ncbi:hypothetical protein JR316_0011487 [Psilocybe cubensis]|uniref:MARVEL domain-containing protein n=2 Tax=Psilocybe cubensis TaxID=181762 RepID=A0A8H8CI27_PSICU|nr:hypothetical protein JR316_0011487 [Psilocybe cubensis]KAH9475925.1 hypothetical protein JR316_0011487 [Psilocybe cubensis]
MPFSAVGKKKLAGHAAFLLVDIIVLALATRVNQFQDFFYVADIFPLALSIISLILVVLLFTVDLALINSYTGRAQSEIGIFGVLSIFWLAFNAFSTARWRQIPFQCDSIPTDFVDEREWCKSLQALKSFVWINFLLCFGIAMFTLRYAIAEYYRGNKHIFQMPLSRYRPELRSDQHFGSGGRGSEFLQFEKMT